MEDFLSAISRDYIENSCGNSFWAPFVRSKKNSTNWIIHDKSKSVETEITFDPWKIKDLGESKQNLDTKKDCMSFNVFSKEYKEEECEDLTFCSFCQIEDEIRKIFNLKIDCEKQFLIDEEYFLIPDSQLKFFGVSGLSNIILNVLNNTGHWTLDLLDENSDSMNAIIVENGTNSLYPIGLLNYISRLKVHQYIYDLSENPTS